MREAERIKCRANFRIWFYRREQEKQRFRSGKYEFLSERLCVLLFSVVNHLLAFIFKLYSLL